MKGRDLGSELTGSIIAEAICVHSTLGPGLLESTYEACLAYRLVAKGLSVRTQVYVPLEFQSLFIPKAYRLDLVVNEAVVVEIKAVETVTAVHVAQLLTYLKLAKFELGLVINFNEVLLKNGIKRIANSH